MMTVTKPLSKTTATWLQKKGYSVENLDEQKNNSATALILASREGSIEIVRDLLAAKVNVNLRNSDRTLNR
jgi:ankyrin repeat protein